MTTITISTPLKLKKTHFANSMEAIFFLSQITLQNDKKTIIKKVTAPKKHLGKEDIAFEIDTTKKNWKTIMNNKLKSGN